MTSRLIVWLLLGFGAVLSSACESTPNTGYLAETVVLMLSMDETGAVRNVQVTQSSGYPEMDRSAVEAAYNWRFQPTLQDGKPVPSQREETIHFRLVGEEYLPY